MFVLCIGLLTLTAGPIQMGFSSLATKSSGNTDVHKWALTSPRPNSFGVRAHKHSTAKLQGNLIRESIPTLLPEIFSCRSPTLVQASLKTSTRRQASAIPSRMY